MSAERESLYELLPAAIRAQDARQGWPLRALLGVVESEYDLLGRDVEQLYDNWFIETCSDWVVPYIGDLLGVRGLLPVAGEAFSQRALVADALSFRRAKGTAAVLERVARAMTGWPAAAVQFFERLATTQYLNHVRLAGAGTVSVRGLDSLDRLGGPFGPAAHTVEVRHVDRNRGRYNLPNVGVFLWRLQSYHLRHHDARAVADPPDGRYTFSPLGQDAPLFFTPRSEGQIEGRVDELDVPGPIRPIASHADLAGYHEKHAATPAQERPANSAFFGPDRSVELLKDGQSVAPFDLVCMNLEPWSQPPAGKVGVDVRRGRIAFAAGERPQQGVSASSSFGLAGDLGGGPYNRQVSATNWLAEDFAPSLFPAGITWQVGVTRDPDIATSSSGPLVDSLADAINLWNGQAANQVGATGLITLMDNRTHSLASPLPDIVVPERGRLAIVAADWPEVVDPDVPGGKQRKLGRFVPDGLRPHVAGDLVVRGNAPTGAADAGRLIVDGLLIEGRLRVAPGNLGALRLAHSTLVPDRGGLLVERADGQANVALRVILARSIAGPIQMEGGEWRLEVRDSLVDAGAAGAVIASQSAALLEASTFFGSCSVGSLNASNCIFTGRVTALRRQTGCTRFCFLPFDSLSPRRYRCQPPDVASAARIAPQFTSTNYGQPGYGQLSAGNPQEIDDGAEDEGQMGAFHFVQQSRRVRNLRAGLDEYLRFGLEAGLFFVT